MVCYSLKIKTNSFNHRFFLFIFAIFGLDKITKITKSVKTEHGTNVEFDLEALKKVLKNPKYEHYPVAIYSIIGPFRSGKSFLLSCWTLFNQCLMVS